MNGQTAPGRSVLCDAHVHLWEDNPPLPQYVVAPGFAANASALIELMNAHGVDQAAVVTPRSMGWDNTITLEAARAYPDRIVAIGLVDPHDPHPEEGLRQLVQSGFAGVRLSPFNEPGQTWLADETLSRFWETAGEARFPIHLHIAPDQLPQVVPIAERFGDVPLVIDHLGRPDVEAGTGAAPFREFLSLARYPKVWAKTPASSFFSRTQPPFLDLVPFLQAALEAYGDNRILWGSDWPGSTTATSFADALEPWFSHCPVLDPQGRANLFGLNFVKLYRKTTSVNEVSM